MLGGVKSMQTEVMYSYISQKHSSLYCLIKQFRSWLKLGFENGTGTPTVTSKLSPGFLIDSKLENTVSL
jgi:hypothetical protein